MNNEHAYDFPVYFIMHQNTSGGHMEMVGGDWKVNRALNYLASSSIEAWVRNTIFNVVFTNGSSVTQCTITAECVVTNLKQSEFCIKLKYTVAH